MTPSTSSSMLASLGKRFGSMRRDVLVERVSELSERMGNTLKSVSVVRSRQTTPHIYRL